MEGYKNDEGNYYTLAGIIRGIYTVLSMITR